MKQSDIGTQASEAVNDRTWGIPEAATYLGCTPGTLRVWISKRRIPHIKVGRLVRFRKDDLEKYLEDHYVAVEERPRAH